MRLIINVRKLLAIITTLHISILPVLLLYFKMSLPSAGEDEEDSTESLNRKRKFSDSSPKFQNLNQTAKEIKSNLKIPYLFFPKKFEFKLFISRLRNGRFTMEENKTVSTEIVYFSKLNSEDSTIVQNFMGELGEGIENHLTYLCAIEVKHNSVVKKYWLMATVLSSSDVGFGIDFSTFIHNLYQHILDGKDDRDSADSIVDNFQFVLLGTCGGSKNHHLGESFFVTRATKFDRGEMTKRKVTEHNNDNEVSPTRKRSESELAGKASNDKPSYETKFDKNLKVHATCSDSFYYLEHLVAHTLSSNYLFYADPHELFQVLEVESDCSNVIVEMETFEFFNICKNFGAHQYGAIRIVSDVYAMEKPDINKIIQQCNFFQIKPEELEMLSHPDVQNDEKKSHLLHKLGRKSLDFTNLITNFLCFLDYNSTKRRSNYQNSHLSQHQSRSVSEYLETVSQNYIGFAGRILLLDDSVEISSAENESSKRDVDSHFRSVQLEINKIVREILNKN